MRHYEIVAVIHPDQHTRAGEMAERYKKIIAEGGGVVHRFEDWGLRTLAYPMRKQRRAQYMLFNIECGEKTLGELEENFRFSEAVMRTLVVRREEAVSVPSPIMKKIREEKLAAEAAAAAEARGEHRGDREQRDYRGNGRGDADSDSGVGAGAGAGADSDSDKRPPRARRVKAETETGGGKKSEGEGKKPAAADGKKADAKTAAADKGDKSKDKPKAKTAKADSKGEGKGDDKKAVRKSRGKGKGKGDEEEGDKSIKAPRKSSAKSRRVKAGDEEDE